MKLTSLLAILTLSFCTLKAELNVREYRTLSKFSELLREEGYENAPSQMKAAILKSDADSELVAALVEAAIIQNPEDEEYIRKIWTYAMATAPDAWDDVDLIVSAYLNSNRKGSKAVILPPRKPVPNPLNLIPPVRVPFPPVVYVTPVTDRPFIPMPEQ